MRNYGNILFDKVLNQINSRKEEIISTKVLSEDFISLQYFLTKNYYYAIIVDDYTFKIFDKESLLEALYYQVKLITVHDLNWDAIQEGLSDILNNLSVFEGICLLFKKGNYLKSNLQNEFNIFCEIIQEINQQNEYKKITILLN